jgi:hypothetical protein
MGSSDTPTCQRCHQGTEVCDVCKGTKEIWGPLGNSSCTECNATGYLCSKHGNYWNR